MSERLFDDIQGVERESTTVQEALTRGVAIDDSGKRAIIPGAEGLENLMGERKIKLYLGIDPTSPDLHIGHTVPLRKLKQFQDLGHEVILLFGTFTGKIGDPSDKTAARIRLTDKQIATNMATYKEQASKILDFSKVKIVQNHEWLGKLTLEEVIDIQANFSVQQMLERKMFQQRLADNKPIWLQEFSYPWMQGWDAVALDVDLEVGGKDQLFNMLVGQTLVQRYKNHEKWVMGTQLIEDPNGVKMGKTNGEIVNIHDLPEVQYEGIMKWPDSAIPMGFELITSVPMNMVYMVNEKLQQPGTNPMELKEALAFRVVLELNGMEAAQFAREEFRRVKREGSLPRRMPEIAIGRGTKISTILLSSGLVKTPEDAATKIAQGSIFVDGKQLNGNHEWPETASTISIGKKTIKNIRRVIIN